MAADGTEAPAPARHRGVLEGVTVLELGVRIGASVAGSMLAQLGATVVFVEGATASGGVATKFSCRPQFAAGKLSLLRESGSETDRRLLAELAAAADVVLLSSDLDPQDIRGCSGAAAGAVVCDITAFGSSGPLAGRPCSDAQIQALSGILGCTGMPTRAPTPIPLPLVEHMAGLYAAGAVLCALRQRRTEGFTQGVEISLYDVAFAAMTSFLAPALDGQLQDSSRVGNRHTMAAPWNVYRAVDGWILLCAGSDEQWRRICRLIGHAALADDPAYAKNADRVVHVEQVDAVVQSWVERHGVEECVRRFGELGLPCGPVARVDGYPREANLAHRRMVHETHDPLTGARVMVPGSVFRMSRSGGQALLRIPLPDADRAAIARLARASPASPAIGAGSPPAKGPLAGIRVLEIGHYTTVPIAARTLASLGAEVIKIEPPEGEAVRRWPPMRCGQGIFFTFQNSDKKSVCVDLGTQEGRVLLTRLIASADILVENLRPGALARKGFSPMEVERINPRLVYCSISGFGADSLYPGRAAFDTVIQAMSGLMDVTRVDGMPMKTGPSSADVMGAACGFAAIVAALEYRDVCGLGQYVDLSMQDIAAWATQTAWNGAPGQPPPPVAESGKHHLLGEGADAVPALAVREVLHAAQTLARGLWFWTEMNGASFPLLAVPLRLLGVPAIVKEPAPPLGRDTEEVERTLPVPAAAFVQE